MSARRLPSFLALLALAPLFAWPARATADPPTTAAGLEFFEKKVRPVLVEHCQRCHGQAQGQKQRGGLLADSRAGLLKGGDTGPAIKPGDPEASLLVKYIRYTGDIRMPPRTRLSDEQIADLTTWVRIGAPWPESSSASVQIARTFDLQQRLRHWAYQPVRRPELPEVKNPSWGQSPIDRFILAGLEARGLAPAEAVDKRTWLRRVTFDLIGLPPTPAEIHAFLADTSTTAWEKVVDRLLDSPHYGERWARHWLDLVRFAETSGHEFDFEIPEAHAYRDYLIRALNADVPYDHLVLEHIAGDLLPQPRRHPQDGGNESVLGTGFWFLGESKHSPVDVRADGCDRRDNQIDVFAKTFLGLTVSCARCHDHKFDAITTRDYYALVGYLQSSRFDRAFLDDPARTAPLIQQLQQLRDQARPLAVAVTAQQLEERLAGLSSWLLTEGFVRRATPPGKPDTHRWRSQPRQLTPQQTGELFAVWSALARPDAETDPRRFAARRQELLQQLQARTARSRDAWQNVKVFVDFARDGYRGWFFNGTAFGSAPTQPGEPVWNSGPGLPVKRLLPAAAHSGQVSPRLQGSLRSATFTIEKKNILYRLAGQGVRINLIIDGFQQIRAPIYGALSFTVQTGAQPTWHVQNVGMWVGQRAYIEVLDDGGGEVALEQVLFSDGGPPEEPANPLWLRLLEDPGLTDSASLARKYQQLLLDVVRSWRQGRRLSAPDAGARLALLNALLASPLADGTGSAPSPEAAQLAALAGQIREAEARLPAPRRGLAMCDGPGANERVHIRGNHKNLGEEVPRRFLEGLGGISQPTTGSGRLDLARRLVDRANPLTARVLVNRLWLYHFGEGIVRSPDDFGVQGQPPTHPELLDWLASELVREGWSLKRLHKLLVLSSTYQMASRADDAVEAADPQNRLWHRLPLRRLEAEAIRDALLSVSGRLDRRMYDRGPLPFLSPFMVGRGRPASGPLDGDGRRSIYLNVRRNFLNPMFLAFDYPIPFTTMGRRSVSNVPAQALTMLNNPLVIQQARLWAQRVLAQPELTATQRVQAMYESAFGREATEAEVADALAFLEEQGREYGSAADVRAWQDFCHVLFNVKEFIFVR
jgi:mono/diheme cytochrome c family protein